jgi:crotonobetainyl-CoA:carnitine CoA-transferase CaiB-like acyl-CoA transferase
MTSIAPDQPLAGVRILSLAEQYPGPYATMLLADLGADVTLVERPNGGDPTRRFSGHFEALNRNKRSVTLDLKTEYGRDALWRLIGNCDAFVEGFKPGVMARLGFGPEDVRQRYPRAIYASISSFGHSGPFSPRGGHDLTMAGVAGFVDTHSRKPAPLPLADLSSAMFAALGIATALLRREKSGEGVTLDVSMLDCLVSWRSTALVSAVNGLDPAPYPPDDPGYGVYETNNGELITLSIAGEDHQWAALCHAVGMDSAAHLTTVDRELAASQLRDDLQKAIRAIDWERLQTDLSANGVGYGPVYSGPETLDDLQVAARGLLVDVPDSSYRVLRQPILMDGKGGVVRSKAPALGEHTAQVLAEVGMTADIISLAGGEAKQELRGQAHAAGI